MAKIIKCMNCGKLKPLFAKRLCQWCYFEQWRVEIICKECGELKPNYAKGLCGTCYNEQGKRKIICQECGELKLYFVRDMCAKCYRLAINYKKPKKKCLKCGELKIHHGKGLCRSCYTKYGQPERICKNCGELKPHSAFGLCHDCYELNRRNTDKEYKLIKRLRDHVRLALKGELKESTTLELLGCSGKEAINHFEGQFVEGMSWDAWGIGEDCWHIDHIKPINTFDLTNPEDRKNCFHYTNLRPLWSKDNLSRPKDGSDIQVKLT